MPARSRSGVMRACWVLLACVVVALPGCMGPGGADDGDEDARPPGASAIAFEGLRFETELGAFTAILFPLEHPATTAFMKKLAENGYYEGREFGRVIPGFVIQEVDRTGGTTDQTEKVPLEAGTSVAFSAGAIGIARDADPNSGGSEFFVMDFAVSPLYANYTSFAQVVGGMDVVHAIARVQAVNTGPAPLVGAPPGSPVYFGIHDRVPVDPVKITKVSVVQVELPVREATRYPLRVGETYRDDKMRATLEWPADLDVGAASTLTWYGAGRGERNPPLVGEPPAFDFAGCTVRVVAPDGGIQSFSTVEDPKAPGKLTWTWTPPARGKYVVHLEKDGESVAYTNVTVPTPPPNL